MRVHTLSVISYLQLVKEYLCGENNITIKDFVYQYVEFDGGKISLTELSVTRSISLGDWKLNSAVNPVVSHACVFTIIVC